MAVYYRGPDHPLSHLHPCQIIIDGVTYNSAEQAYQYAKARCARDHVSMDRIIVTNDPFEIKAVGRAVRIQKTQWEKVKGQIMYKIDYHKFHENAGLRQFLLATSGRDLIEDLPDPFWGGKMGGRNEAGRILMQLRDRFLPPPAAAAAASASAVSAAPRFFGSAYVVGDSLVKGIHIPGVTTISVPGAQQQLVTRAAEAIIGPGTKYLFVIAGTNDFVRRDGTIGPCNLIIQKYFEWAYGLASQNAALTIIISTIFPRSAGATYPDYMQRKLETCRQLLLTNVNELPRNVYVMDAQSVISASDLGPDGLHLSLDGVQKIRDAFIEIMT